MGKLDTVSETLSFMVSLSLYPDAPHQGFIDIPYHCCQMIIRVYQKRCGICGNAFLKLNLNVVAHLMAEVFYYIAHIGLCHCLSVQGEEELREVGRQKISRGCHEYHSVVQTDIYSCLFCVK